jgi:hypothetical protein
MHSQNVIACVFLWVPPVVLQECTGSIPGGTGLRSQQQHCNAAHGLLQDARGAAWPVSLVGQQVCMQPCSWHPERHRGCVVSVECVRYTILKMCGQQGRPFRRRGVVRCSVRFNKLMWGWHLGCREQQHSNSTTYFAVQTSCKVPRALRYHTHTFYMPLTQTDTIETFERAELVNDGQCSCRLWTAVSPRSILRHTVHNLVSR